MLRTIWNVATKVIGAVLPDKPKEVIRGMIGEAIKSDEGLRIELEKLELEVEDARDQRKLITTALRSEDPYVRRARPTFLWLMYVVIAVNFIMFPTFWMLGVGRQPFINLPSALYYLFGTAFLGYGAVRSWDKRNGGFSKLIGSFQQKIK